MSGPTRRTILLAGGAISLEFLLKQCLPSPKKNGQAELGKDELINILKEIGYSSLESNLVLDEISHGRAADGTTELEREENICRKYQLAFWLNNGDGRIVDIYDGYPRDGNIDSISISSDDATYISTDSPPLGHRIHFSWRANESEEPNKVRDVGQRLYEILEQRYFG